MPAFPSLQPLALLAIDPDLTVQAISTCSSAFVDKQESSTASNEEDEHSSTCACTDASTKDARRSSSTLGVHILNLAANLRKAVAEEASRPKTDRGWTSRTRTCTRGEKGTGADYHGTAISGSMPYLSYKNVKEVTAFQPDDPEE